MPEKENINLSTNTQTQAWDNLARDVANNTTPAAAHDEAVGTLDDGVDIGTAPFAEPKADQIETDLEQADGTTHLRTEPAATAVTMPEMKPETELEPGPEPKPETQLAAGPEPEANLAAGPAPAPELDASSAEHPAEHPAEDAATAEQHAEADQATADEAYHIEEPNAPEL